MKISKSNKILFLLSLCLEAFLLSNLAPDLNSMPILHFSHFGPFLTNVKHQGLTRNREMD